MFHQCLVTGFWARGAAGATPGSHEFGVVGKILAPDIKVALNLASDRACCSDQTLADPGFGHANHVEIKDDFSFRFGKMMVGHRDGSFRLKLVLNLNLPGSLRDVRFFLRFVALQM